MRLTGDQWGMLSGVRRLASGVDAWFERIDPGVHRRIKGLRLVTAFGLAAMLGTMPEIAGHGLRLITLASGFVLWASVSEARPTRFESTRDLVLLNVAAGFGAASVALSVIKACPTSPVRAPAQSPIKTSIVSLELFIGSLWGW